MLQNDRYDDLNRMYRLLRQTGPAGLDEAKQGLIAHVRDTGRELVSDPERQKDPVAFVNRLLEEKDKYDRIVAKAFGGDKQFQNALNLAFEAFMNSNGRCPEFLSLFVDDKLRKGVKARRSRPPPRTCFRSRRLRPGSCAHSLRPSLVPGGARLAQFLAVLPRAPALSPPPGA